MTDRTWHASAEQLHRFANHSELMEPTTAASLEAHLVGCDACRRDLAAAADPVTIARSWDALTDRIDQPRCSIVERALVRLGARSGWARLIAATPSLRASGLVGVALVAAAAVAMARGIGAEGPFLAAAPLVPLAVVAVSFRPGADPIGGASVATPMHGIGLVLRRAVAILTVSFALLGVAALALPNLDVEAAAWVLPALALSVGAIALSTWIRLETAVAVLGGGWLMTLTALWWLAGRAVVAVDSPSFVLATQLSALAVAVVAMAVVGARRDRLATLEAFR